MASIKHLVHLNATPQAVYALVTTQAGLAAWWTYDTIARPEIGFLNEFRFGPPHFIQMKVIALAPNHVGWECTDADPQWIGTTVTFDFEANGEQTVLRFAHSNWREETDFFASCNYHWGRYLHSLKQLCETGTGEPFSEAMVPAN